MYVEKNELSTEILYQGDLIKDFPFLIFDKEEPIENFTQDGETKLNINAKLSLVMILSQTCDVQRRKNIIICPVYKVKDFEFSKDELIKIKKRRTGYWFYLPEIEGVLEESIADFQTIFYASRKLIENYKSNKIATLSDWGRHHLGWALSGYFGRPIESK